MHTRVLISTLALAAALAACSDLGEPVVGGPCALDTDMLDFGRVIVGNSGERILRVRNNSGSSVGIDVVAPCASGFEVVDGAVQTIPPGGSGTITVRFAPTATGGAECELRVDLDCGVALCVGLGVNAPTVSFAADVQPIFDGHCIGCHRLFGEAELDLREGLSYDQIVGHVSRNYAPAFRIQPADPSASVLFNKITDSDVFGDVMPPIGGGSDPVSADDIEIIRDWILEGALEN